MIPFGLALEKTGAAERLAHGAVTVLKDSAPWRYGRAAALWRPLSPS